MSRLKETRPSHPESKALEAHINENPQDGAGSSQIEDMTRHWSDTAGLLTRDTRSKFGLDTQHDVALSKQLAKEIMTDVPKEEQALTRTYNMLSLHEVRLTHDQRKLQAEFTQFMSNPGQQADQNREKIQELEGRQQDLKNRRRDLNTKWENYNQRKDNFERMQRPSLQNALDILRRASPDARPNAKPDAASRRTAPEN